MKKILLIHPPFCTPVSPSYAISHIYSALKSNCPDVSVAALDLNLEFHALRYPAFQKYSQTFLEDYSPKEYEIRMKKFLSETKQDYSLSNRNVVHDIEPLMFSEMLDIVMSHSPDIVAFSIVYSSQVFYTYALIKVLKEKGVVTVVGGPAVNSLLLKTADKTIADEKGLVEFVIGRKAEIAGNCLPDFSIWDEKGYFTPSLVVPLKTCSTCYYKQCAYCAHYASEQYKEYPITEIALSAKGQKLVFMVDDMIKKERLLSLAEVFKAEGITWTCQLRPTKEYDTNTLKILSDSGLKMLMWGVESGSDRVLSLIGKGTNTADIQKVLADSHAAGIRNICYTLFGFPTETEAESIQTIDFIQANKEYIDLVSTSVFGLQKGTPIYRNPFRYGISEIIEEKRTILDEKIDYTVSSGLSNKDAKKIRDRYKKTLEKLDRYPKSMNFFREHMLCLIRKESLGQ
jgi:hypothetical protein